MTPNHQIENARTPANTRQSGMSLLELVIAMSVLAVGMLGAVVMILAGAQANQRNKTDSTAVVLDQELLEMFGTLQTFPSAVAKTVYDCNVAAGNLNQHLASLAAGAAPAGAGAILYTGATAPLPAQVGDIDWTQPTPALATAGVAGYAMRYQSCSGDIYEVRWNIMQVNLNAVSNTSRNSLLTVSARQFAAQGRHSSLLFSNPTTLRTMIQN